MSNEQKKSYNRGQPLNDHTPDQRRKEIIEILRDKSIQTTTLDDLVRELYKRGIETTQGTVTKDKNKWLHFKLMNENGTLCYRMPETAEFEQLNGEIREICKTAGITFQSMEQEIKALHIKTNGYSHILSDKLKKRFPKAIVDTQPLENILIVYYTEKYIEPVSGIGGFRSMLIKTMTGKSPKLKHKLSVDDTANDEDIPPIE